MTVSGWHVVARKSELIEPLTAVFVAGQRLLILRHGDCIRVFSGVCPHRGADLGLGTLVGSDTVRCRFHGLVIGLGEVLGRPRFVPEFTSVVLGDLIVMRFSDGPECGFVDAATQLATSHRISNAVTLQIRVPYTHVIENAFDELHFVPVHDVSRLHRFSLEHDASGAISVSSRFVVPPSRWQKSLLGKREVDVPFRATAYSPGLVVTHMGGKRPYVVITGSTPTDAKDANDCVVHLAIAVPYSMDDVSTDDIDYLLRQGIAGIEKDRIIWETLTPGICKLEPAEQSVLAFRQFCTLFDPGLS